MKGILCLIAILFAFSSYAQTLKVRGKITSKEAIVENVEIKFFAANNRLLAKMTSNNGYYQCDLPYFDRYILHVEKKGYIISPVMISTKISNQVDWFEMWREFRLDLEIEEKHDTSIFYSEKVNFNPRKLIYFSETSRTPTIIGEYMNNQEADRPYRKLNQLVMNAFDNPASDKKRKTTVKIKVDFVAEDVDKAN